MKETTVNSLVVARTLFEEAEGLCIADDRYLASAGLVLLQDALELIFYALLIERGVDETKNLEGKSFDELIGELKKNNVAIPKSGTLKALNKQRLLTKHYAQVAEPATVKSYFYSAKNATESILKSVTGRSLSEIYLADLLGKSEAKDYLLRAEDLIGASKYLEALTEIRKAIFIEFEEDYSIYGWRDYTGTEGDLLGFYLAGGWKAPFYTRYKKWIDENVKDPLDFIQIDYEKWRLDAMEWGINTAELQNLRRLTPDVFRSKRKGPWHIKYKMSYEANEANIENARYCLDHAISVILKKQIHKRTSRSPRTDNFAEIPDLYLGDKIYSRASAESEIVHTLAEGDEYSVDSLVTGFTSDVSFYYVKVTSQEGVFRGYLVKKPENNERGHAP